MSNIQSKLVNLGGNITGTLPIANGGTANVTASAAFNALSPITTTGDMIYSSSGTTNSRLAIGASGTVLHGGTTPSYSQIVNADIDAAAAIDGSKLVAATGSVPGAVTTTTQTFAGVKTFNSGIVAGTGSSTLSAFTNWTNVAYSSGNFTGSGSMTWTVESGDQTTYQYYILQNVMVISFFLSTTTLGGTPSTQLRIAIPASKTAAARTSSFIYSTPAGVGEVAYCEVAAVSDAYISLSRVGGGNWSTTGSNNNYFQGQIAIQIN